MKEQKSTFSLYYYINKARKDSKKRCPVSVKITLNGTETTASIHRKICIDNWVAEGGYPVGKTEEVKELKNYMTVLNSKFLESHKKLIQTESYISAQMLKAYVFGTHYEEQTGIQKLYKERIDKEYNLYVKKVKSITPYNRCFYGSQYLGDFLKEKYGLEDIAVKKIDDRFIEKYIDYLTTRNKKRAGSEFSDKLLGKSYLKGILSKFKSVLDTAKKSKLITENPMEDFSFGLGNQDKVTYLTLEELSLVMNAELKEDYLVRERYFYLFCCFTGLSNCDFTGLKRINLEKENGKWWVRTYRNKTVVLSNVPLLPQAEAILRIFQPDFEKLGYEELLFPVGSLCSRNMHLREIASLCGISKKLTTHVARHTFGTTITLTNGVPLESVSKMLGHKSLRMTERYAKIINAKIEKDTENLSRKLDSMLISRML